MIPEASEDITGPIIAALLFPDPSGEMIIIHAFPVTGSDPPRSIGPPIPDHARFPASPGSVPAVPDPGPLLLCFSPLPPPRSSPRSSACLPAAFVPAVLPFPPFWLVLPSVCPRLCAFLPPLSRFYPSSSPVLWDSPRILPPVFSGPLLAFYGPLTPGSPRSILPASGGPLHGSPDAPAPPGPVLGPVKWYFLARASKIPRFV